MPSKTKRVPKSKLKWVYALPVPQLVYAAKALVIAHEGLEKAQLIEAIVTHKRVGRLKQCDVTERRPTWDELWKKIDWDEWERGWRWSYDNNQLGYKRAEQGKDIYPHQMRPAEHQCVFGDGSPAWPDWANEHDPTKSKKLYAKSLGYNWVHPWGR